MDQISYLLFRVIKLALLFYILFLVFTNFGTFLLVVVGFMVAIYLFVYNKIRQIKKQAGQGNFHFKFNANDFRKYQQSNGQGNFNFNHDAFGHAHLSEVQDAKDFFGFIESPTELVLKKKYRELAKKYHPDINGGDDAMMQKLNHYRDILVKSIKG